MINKKQQKKAQLSYHTGSISLLIQAIQHRSRIHNFEVNCQIYQSNSSGLHTINHCQVCEWGVLWCSFTYLHLIIKLHLTHHAHGPAEQVMIMWERWSDLFHETHLWHDKHPKWQLSIEVALCCGKADCHLTWHMTAASRGVKWHAKCN